MYALHSTLLPPSAIYHSLYLANFTPSTIYPSPRASTSTAPDVKVIGNLILGGGSDLRVFEIWEEHKPILPSVKDRLVNGLNGHADVKQDLEVEEDAVVVSGEELGDSFFDNGHSDRAPVKYETTQSLHLLTSHQLHGTITGLASLQTIESGADGLDRLLVSFKDAKMAILEWARGDIVTVSLHTYERCSQMTTGDLSTYVPLLRVDPLSRMAVLTLPEDSLAMLPVLQEQSDLDIIESFPRDVPYSPSFVLSLPEALTSVKNMIDLTFLPGFHSPTLALLFNPAQTWAGRYYSLRDTFVLEIRTVDPSTTSSYPLLTRVENLPSDSLYLVAAPRELGGVVLVASSGIMHIDQSGRVAAASVNGWWWRTTNRPANRDSESRQITLEGSRCSFVGDQGADKEMLLVLANGAAHHVRFEMDGRNVDTIRIEDECMIAPPPSGLARIGNESVFVGTSEGDSVLLATQLVREVVQIEHTDTKPDLDMEVDYDTVANGGVNGTSHEIATGPARLVLREMDRLAGVGKIIDMELGIAATDQGVRTYPQLVAIGGGTRNSTMNVFRRGIPINKRRRFNELSNAEGVWFLPIQRHSGQKFRTVPDDQRTTLLLTSEGSQTRVFSLSNKANPEQIGRLPHPTIHAAPFFQRSTVLQVGPHSINLLDNDGRHLHTVYNSETPITWASISDPYIVIRKAGSTAILFVGDSATRSISDTSFTPNEDQPLVQAIEVFTDSTGIYRTFEPVQPTSPITNGGDPGSPSLYSTSPNSRSRNGTSNANGSGHPRNQATAERIHRLQETKPVVSSQQPHAEEAMRSAKGTQWLSVLTVSGELQIRSLPDLSMAFQSYGLAASQATFTDDAAEGGAGQILEDPDEIRQILFNPLGSRPHLLVLHQSGRLNIYEAQPRFTLDNQTSRRSLAIRYRKVHTQLLSTTSNLALAAGTVFARLPYKMHPFEDLEGQTGVFVTGEKPQWIMGSEKHAVRSFGLKQAAATFARTTHLGGMGEYFIRIEDGTFICYLPPTLTSDFEIPCDRYEMDRVYTNIAFDPPSAHYVGAAAITVPFQAYDEEGEIQLGPEGENLIPPTNERSSLELFSQGSDAWRVIDGYDFDQNEVVLAMQSVNLESASMPGGHRDFIAVGTGFDFAEDRATRGNTYIFEVVQVVGQTPKDPGYRLKLRTKDPARNPVSALGNINGYLINSNGPKMYVKGLDNDERLMGLAFLDINLYVTSINVFKNFMIIGDLLKSVWFVSFQENPYKFVTISRDLTEIHAITGDFMVQEGQMTFISTDRHGVMRMLDFDPLDPDSLNGERLMLRTEFHMGVPVTVSKTIARRRTTDEEFAPQTQLIYGRADLSGTADGALTSLVSVKPARFKRLQLVAEQLTRNAQHIAGLNPKAFRAVKNDILPKPLSRGILDGQLLSHFAVQPVQRQREMMRQIGTDEITVASDLQALSGFW